MLRAQQYELKIQSSINSISDLNSQIDLCKQQITQIKKQN